MAIERLQQKRVKGNWDTHKGYVPLDGEYVFIESGVIADNTMGNIIVVGDGTNNLEKLVSDKTRVYYSAEKLGALLVDMKKDFPSGSDINTTPIVKYSDEEDNSGSIESYSRADHTHSLNLDTAHEILDVNGGMGSLRCRRIIYGTNSPENYTALNQSAQPGDIFIKY